MGNRELSLAQIFPTSFLWETLLISGELLIAGIFRPS